MCIITIRSLQRETIRENQIGSSCEDMNRCHSLSADVISVDEIA